jgi:hypothetical protein
MTSIPLRWTSRDEAVKFQGAHVMPCFSLLAKP